MPETQVQSLGWEDPLKKGMATHFSILAWRIPWNFEKPGGLQSIGVTKSQTGLGNFYVSLSLQTKAERIPYRR